MPRVVVMRALRRFQGREGTLRPGRRFRTTEARAQRLAAAKPPFAERLSAEDWPLKMSPEAYLKLHPDKQHAALARRLTGKP